MEPLGLTIKNYDVHTALSCMELGLTIKHYDVLETLSQDCIGQIGQQIVKMVVSTCCEEGLEDI